MCAYVYACVWRPEINTGYLQLFSTCMFFYIYLFCGCAHVCVCVLYVYYGLPVGSEDDLCESVLPLHQLSGVGQVPSPAQSSHWPHLSF